MKGQPVKFIVCPTEKDPLKATHSKFLDRSIHYSLSDERIQEERHEYYIEAMDINES